MPKDQCGRLTPGLSYAQAKVQQVIKEYYQSPDKSKLLAIADLGRVFLNVCAPLAAEADLDARSYHELYELCADVVRQSDAPHLMAFPDSDSKLTLVVDVLYEVQREIREAKAEVIKRRQRRMTLPEVRVA